MIDYQHKSIQKLSELYEKHKAELGRGMGMMNLMWKALSPQIPEILQGLDENPERLSQIKGFLEEIVKALREDVKKVKKVAKPEVALGEESAEEAQ